MRPFEQGKLAHPLAALERNLVVHVAALAAGAHGRRLARLSTRGTEIAAAARVSGEIAAPAQLVEHGELRVEALQHDLGGVAVLAVLVLPFAGLQRAFEVNLRAFLEVLLDDLAEPLVEDHHPVPLGLLAPLPGRLVAPGLAGGDAQIGDRPAILGAPDLRIRPQIADQDHLVDRTRHDTLSPAAISAMPAIWMPLPVAATGNVAPATNIAPATRGHPRPKPDPSHG